MTNVHQVTKTPLGRVAARALPPAAAAMTAYDLGHAVCEENAKPDPLLNGPEQGNFPATPGNPNFHARQQRLARQVHGQAPLRQAAALEIPANIPRGATAAADQASAFDAKLEAFIAAINEHNASLAPVEGP